MTDYCTFFPEGWWAHCCEAHDNDYTLQIGQTLADEQLFLCVTSSNEDMALVSALIAFVMFVGVRAFGKRFYKPRK